MRKVIIAVAILLTVSIARPETNRVVTASWDYPPAELTNMVFRVHQTTNITLALTNWTVLTNVTGKTSVKLSVPGGVNHFAVSASNFWGSVFSSVVSTPTLPRSDVNLQLQRD